MIVHSHERSLLYSLTEHMHLQSSQSTIIQFVVLRPFKLIAQSSKQNVHNMRITSLSRYRVQSIFAWCKRNALLYSMYIMYFSCFVIPDYVNGVYCIR